MHDASGYGRVSVKINNRFRVRLAHRVVYECLIGQIPEGLVIDHLCRTPACVNPSHLEPVTIGENSRRGQLYTLIRQRAAARKHCDKGHEYPTSWAEYDHRRCMTCHKEYQKNYKLANREHLNRLARDRKRKDRERRRLAGKENADG